MLVRNQFGLTDVISKTVSRTHDFNRMIGPVSLIRLPTAGKRSSPATVMGQITAAFEYPIRCSANNSTESNICTSAEWPGVPDFVELHIAPPE